MRWMRVVCAGVVILAAAVAEGQVGGRGGRGGPRQQPCWQQAGITQGAIYERRQILQKMWNDIDLVCNNSALSAEQKRERVAEVRAQARQELSNVVTPQQELLMQQCRQQRQVSGGPQNRRGGWGGDLPAGRVYDNPCGPPKQPAAQPDPGKTPH